MYTTLDLCIISASNLSTVEADADADVYVVACLISGSDEPLAAQSTSFASAICSNPTWNFPVHFPVPDQIPPSTLPIVCLQLRCYHQGYLNYEEEIGQVYLPISNLLDSESPGSSQFVTYVIPDKFGAPIGELKLSYKFTGGNQRIWRSPTPSAPPLPFPPPPDPPPPQPQERGRARDFTVKAAMAAAAALMAPQMTDLLAKVQELVVAIIALALAFFLVVGFLILMPNLLRRVVAANRNGTRR